MIVKPGDKVIYSNPVYISKDQVVGRVYTVEKVQSVLYVIESDYCMHYQEVELLSFKHYYNALQR